MAVKKKKKKRRITHASAKNKGRTLQKWTIQKLIDILNIHPEDIENRSMGAGGEDVIMSRAARDKFPFSIECKNQEAINVWASYEQSKANCGNYEPIVIIKRRAQKRPLIVLDAETFIKLTARMNP